MTHRLESFREAPVRAVGALGVALCLAFAAGGTRATPPLVQAGQDSASRLVIVRAASAASAAAAVVSVGGTVQRVLDIVQGVSAAVPVGALGRLRTVATVTDDAHGRLLAVDPALGYDPSADMGSLNAVTRITNAQSAWKSGYTGKGVDIALIDSGVSDVAGLGGGHVVNGPDLSFESQDPTLAHRDTFGHGTHMASIIAGRDAGAGAATYADPATFAGVAPDARLISLKVAAADGGVDVSQVIAAIGWVTEHARDPGFNIRVINLSFGTDSTQSYLLDPLAYAAEAAWRNGIVVVAAGGNDGTVHPTLSDPASDPTVIAVGAEDPMGTVATGDDTVPAFASRGTNVRHVDLVAPAVHVIGLRCPGCAIDLANPAGRVGSRFLRGSGTSQAAAVVSGAVAVLLQRYPLLTPDGVKKLLMTTANGFPGSNALYRGSGALNLGKAVATAAPGVAAAPIAATGTGSLDAARGSARVSTGGVDLVGERDVMGNAWNGTTWAPQALARTSWTAGAWNGAQWTGNGWSSMSWLGATWAVVPWAGNDWSSTPWSSHSWTSHSWTAAGWDGADWTSHSWTSHSWTASTWAGVSWN